MMAIGVILREPVSMAMVSPRASFSSTALVAYHKAEKTTVISTQIVGIGTFKMFMVRYNVDISLTIQYLNNIFNNTACFPGTQFFSI